MLLIIVIHNIDYEYLFECLQSYNTSVKRLVVFENFSQQYAHSVQRSFGTDEFCESFRQPAREVSRAIARQSRRLEHLAASFIVEASQFFATRRSCEWPNLASLVLTSKVLVPDESRDNILHLLLVSAPIFINIACLPILASITGLEILANENF